MRIGLDGTTLGGEKSGIGYYSDRLFAHLMKIDRENDYLLFSNRRIEGEEMEPLSPRCAYYRRYRFPIRALWMQFVLPCILRRTRPALCHFTNFLAPLTSMCPLVVTIHDMTLHLFPGYHPLKKRLLTRPLIPLVARKAKKIITVSESSKRDIVDILDVPADKVQVIYEAASPRFRRIEDGDELRRVRAKYYLDGRYILFVGMIEPRKNLSRTLEALDLLKRRERIAHKLLVVGGRGYRSEEVFRKAEALSLKEEVIFAGYVPSEDLPALYSMADAFVFPSLYEGFGLPVIEAMACGTPVLTSNNSSLSEIAGGAAITVDPTDVGGIASGLLKILTDEELRAQLREKGLKRAASFSWDRAAGDTLEVYREVSREEQRSRGARENSTPAPLHPCAPAGKGREGKEEDSPLYEHLAKSRSKASRDQFAVLKTVIYAGLFDYPLTLDEIRTGLFDLRVSKEGVERALAAESLVGTSIRRGMGFFFPEGREDLIGLRLSRERRTDLLLRRAEGPLRIVAALPFVRMIALSGGVSFKNVSEEDLDLFVIAKRDRVWLCNLLIVVVSKFLGVRDLICANYLVDEESLRMARRDFFTAHQIIHLKPIYGVDRYLDLLRENPWISRYFPNFLPLSGGRWSILDVRRSGKIKRFLEHLIDGLGGRCLEGLIHRVYGRYLRKKELRAGGEADVQLSSGQIKLHFSDHRGRITREFRAALAEVFEK